MDSIPDPPSCQCENCCGRLRERQAEAKEDASAKPLPPAEDRRSNEQKNIDNFSNKTGLSVVLNGKNYDYKMSLSGKDVTVFSTDAGPKWLEAAEKQLAKLTTEKQSELETKFKIEFSKTGDDVIKQRIWKPDCTVEYGPMIKARAPKLSELYGIEAALYRTQPSQLDPDGKRGLKFHFLEERYYKGDGVLAYFIPSDKDNRPAVYFEPGANSQKPITEADADRIGKHRLYSIEAVTVHELSHHHQKKRGWDDTAYYEKRAKELGWMPFVDKKTKESGFLLQGKNGEYYRLGRDKCPDDSVWVRTDKNGQPLDSAGKPSGSFKDAKQYSNTEVMKSAALLPPTNYFDNPKEEYAEALMLFRLGDKRRAQLLRDNPQAYEAVKSADQSESVAHYGKQADNSPKYIRSVDGPWVENTDKNRQAVEAFETKIRQEKQEKKVSVRSGREQSRFAYAG